MAFEYAQAVSATAEKLIADYHVELEGVRIEYIWVNKPIVRAGRITLGRARKITGLAAFLASGEPLDEDDDQAFFVIEIDRSSWPKLTTQEQLALVDHELTHCFVDEDGKLSITPHDLEEFYSVVKRHGLWSEALQRFSELSPTQEGNSDGESSSEV